MWFALLLGGEKFDNPESYEGDDAGECSDGADNDLDGLFDCNDDGCVGSPDCEQTDEPSDEPSSEDTGDTNDTSDTSDTTDTTDTNDTMDTGDDLSPECNPALEI